MVQSGKVIPISEALQIGSTRDLSTVRLSNPLMSKFSRGGTEQPHRAVKSLDYRISSGSTDLEAQKDGTESWEANLKRLHDLEERLRKSRSRVLSQISEAERRTSASSQKITASLKKAYKGTPAVETETVDIPPTLGSKPTEIRTMVRKKQSNTQRRMSSHSSTENARTDFTTNREPQRKRRELPNPSRISSFDPVAFAVSTNSIQLPPPVLSIDTRRLPSRSKRSKKPAPASFLSMSTSPASSEASKHAVSTAEDILLPLAENRHAQNISRFSTTSGDKPPRPKSRVVRNQSNDIIASSSQMRDTSFINSATASTITTPNIQRVSMMSNNSIATFASSDISSTWTFGNAQPVTILPSVAPDAAPALPDLERLKSKYGRYSNVKEKALPVPPSSPLSR